MKASAIGIPTSSVGPVRLAAVLAVVLFALSLPFLITGPAYQRSDADIVGP